MAINLQDSKRAAEFFKLPAGRTPGGPLVTGYDSINAPRFKFMWFVSFFLEPQLNLTFAPISQRVKGMADISFEAKTVDKPKVNVQTETLNQYNKKRLIHTKVDYQPITVRFHDTVADKVLKLWHEYAAFYNNDFSFVKKHEDWNDDILNPEFEMGTDGWGFNIRNKMQPGSSNFFNRIEIYNVFGGEYSQITLVRPKIQSFDPDTLDYSASGDIQEIGITFSYEGLIYKERSNIPAEIINRFNLQIIRPEGKGASPEPDNTRISEEQNRQFQLDAVSNISKGITQAENLIKNPVSFLSEIGENIASDVLNELSNTADDTLGSIIPDTILDEVSNFDSRVQQVNNIVNNLNSVINNTPTTPADVLKKANDVRALIDQAKNLTNSITNNAVLPGIASDRNVRITINKPNMDYNEVSRILNKLEGKNNGILNQSVQTSRESK